MAKAVRITLKLLEESGPSGACNPGIEAFRARIAGTGQDGYDWTEAEAKRIYEQNPAFLRWLERHGVVPMLDVKGIPSVAERVELNKSQHERRRPKGMQQQRRGRR